MRVHPARPRRQLRPFLGPFHAVAVGCSRLAFDPPHRFEMGFSQQDTLPPQPVLQLRPKAPQHPTAVFHQVLPLPLVTPVKRRPLPLAPALQLPERLPPPPLIPRPVRALLRPLPSHPLPIRSTPTVPGLPGSLPAAPAARSSPAAGAAPSGARPDPEPVSLAPTSHSQCSLVHGPPRPEFGGCRGRSLP